MVLAHRACPELRPLVAAEMEAARRTLDRVRERRRLVAREREAVPPARIRVEIAYRVREAADGAHHGDRPVAERDELAQPARLEPRRHEEEVRAGVDALRQRGVEAEREREPALLLRGEPAPLRLVHGIACAEHHELPAAGED